MNLSRPRILVGYDGSDESRQAVQWASDHARRAEGTIHLVTAWDWPTFESAPIVYGSYDPKRAAWETLDRLRGQLTLPPKDITRTVARGPAAQVLADASADADLLVVGSHGLGMWSRLVLGSVSARCASHAHCPVVIVRPPDPKAIKHVAVGVDDSEDSRRALIWAMDYADLVHHPLTVIHVTESPTPPVAGGYPAVYTYPRADVHRAIRVWLRGEVEKAEAERGSKFGRGVTLKVLEGNPGRVMVERSRESALTVIGRRGSGGFRRLVIGSVAGAMAHHGQSTVVVVANDK